jgi:protein-(glutamine-N5) methyltransferase, release factor-specific
METMQQLYQEARRRLAASGVENAAFDAACILEKHTGVRRTELPLCGGSAPACDLAAFWRDVPRRETREPLQYILGIWPFYGLDFYVGGGVLIPRQETELLAETAIGFLKARRTPKLLELCAGSGCLTAAVLKHVETASAVCVELSGDAIGYLERNLEFHGLAGRAEILRADMLSPAAADLLKERYGVFDAVVCNPPYIPRGEIAALQPEVSAYEPRMALDGGEDGLAFYRAFGLYRPLLAPGGMAAFETGMGQAPGVAAILKEHGLCNAFIKKDLAGIERTVGAFAISL